MHGFDSLIAEILETEGYWVPRGHKVNLTKEEKVAIGRPSSPRGEIDLIAYRAPENVVIALECKSYLDSPGVDLADLQGGRYATRYKLFTDPNLRKVVLRRLARGLVSDGYCRPRPRLRLALAAGKLRSDPEALNADFREEGWELFDPDWIRYHLKATADAGCSDSVAMMVAKMLLRWPAVYLLHTAGVLAWGHQCDIE